MQGHPETEMPFISIGTALTPLVARAGYENLGCCLNLCRPLKRASVDGAAAEMWRGFRDCGEALTAIGGPAATLGKAMSTEAPPLLAQLRKSMAMDAGPPTSKPRCFPYVAGIKECGCAPSPNPQILDRDPHLVASSTCADRRSTAVAG